MNIPNPGSAEAQKQECTCPVMDNNYGAGVMVKGEAVFWKSSNCPLHGWEDKNNRPFKLGHKEENGKSTTTNRT